MILFQSERGVSEWNKATSCSNRRVVGFGVRSSFPCYDEIFALMDEEGWQKVCGFGFKADDGTVGRERFGRSWLGDIVHCVSQHHNKSEVWNREAEGRVGPYTRFPFSCSLSLSPPYSITILP